ncbi:MAG: sulfotransferase [Planctomycetia bacterium]|nr:sulfotransferase [Planctomycetia bacterium]
MREDEATGLTALPGNHDEPVVVGGVGGSGTRLIAAILRESGYFIGDDLNAALDNRWFSLLFNRPGIQHCPDEEFHRLLGILVNRMVGDAQFDPADVALIEALAQHDNPPHSADWMRERAGTLLAPRIGPPPGGRWGWKEPNTHVVLPRLARALPRMRYVFVSRSGLDMAYSANTNQAMRWGEAYLGRPFEPTPRYMLSFWVAAHRRVLAAAAAVPVRFHFIRLEAFCGRPAAGLLSLYEFLGLSGEPSAGLIALAQSPESIGRFREHGLAHFDPDDVAYVESLGFCIA